MADTPQELKPLLPCPFCGHMPFTHDEVSNEHGELEAVCLNHDCAIGGMGISLKFWNTRCAAEPVDAGELDAALQIIDLPLPNFDKIPTQAKGEG